MALSEDETAQEKLAWEVRRGAEGKGLMENPLFVEAFTNLRAVYTSQLVNSPVEKPEIREVARFRLEALEFIEGELRHIVETGMLAGRSVDEAQEQQRIFEQDVAENG